MGGRGMRMHSKTIWPSASSGPRPRHVAKIGRNDPCPCESGKKYKECHEREGKAFLEKLARQADKVQLKETRARLKADGVPWYRRIFVGLH